MLFANCELTKRRYTKGWFISGIALKKNAHSIKKSEQENFAMLVHETKKPIVLRPEHDERSSMPSDSTTPVKKKGRFRRAIENFDNRTDSITERLRRRFGGSGKDSIHVYNNKRYLIGEYSCFTLAATSWTLFGIALNNFIKYALAFAGLGILFFVISLAISFNAQERIRNGKLAHKLWPHRLVTNFAITVLVLGISVLIALLVALFTSSIELTVAVLIVAFIAGMLITFIGIQDS